MKIKTMRKINKISTKTVSTIEYILKNILGKNICKVLESKLSIKFAIAMTIFGTLGIVASTIQELLKGNILGAIALSLLSLVLILIIMDEVKDYTIDYLKNTEDEKLY